MRGREGLRAFGGYLVIVAVCAVAAAVMALLSLVLT